ncbi:MAG: hypothetical protein F4W91_22885 [Gemmatimonadetes bacterium]|nr:hypothetical protein [Gemmatimonadota bacterium]
MARSHILKGFSDLESALWIHKYHPGLTIRRQMVKVALENGYSVTDSARYEAVQLLSEWGLADGKSGSLTPEGQLFYSLWETKRSTAIDFLHGRQYGLWTQNQPDQNIASWAYKNICDYLWTRQTLPDKGDLVTYINDLRASDEVVIPPDMGNAFSNKSINDAYDWLRPLDPPVLANGGVGHKSLNGATFAQRAFCSTLLFLMGLGYIVRETNTVFGDLVKIDDTRKQAVCCFCLISEIGFDLMLDEALRQVSYLSVQRGWDGIYMELNQKPEVRDFIE